LIQTQFTQLQLGLVEQGLRLSLALAQQVQMGLIQLLVLLRLQQLAAAVAVDLT
jgi:hypothetical protein